MDKEQIQALIERSKNNDKQAFTLLICEYRTFVFRLAFRLLCNEEDAKDYVLTAESRTPNRWAFIVTVLLIVVLAGWLIKSVRR